MKTSHVIAENLGVLVRNIHRDELTMRKVLDRSCGIENEKCTARKVKKVSRRYLAKD